MSLKLVSSIVIKFLFFHQMTALQKLWKMLFYFKKDLFVLEIIKFFYFRPSLFFSLSTIALEDDRILEFRVYDASNCQNKN